MQFGRLYKILFVTFALNITTVYTAEAFQSTFGLQLHQGQTDLTTLSTDAVTAYSGPGYIGEITFNLYDSDLAKKVSSQTGLQPGLNIFFFGGSTKETNTASVVGDVKSNQIAGVGVDLRLRSFFIGSFAQSNNSTITTSTTATNFSFTTFGLRTGFEFLIGGSDSSTRLQIGALYDVGRTPITPVGVWYVTSTSFFTGIKFRLWESSVGSSK